MSQWSIEHLLQMDPYDFEKLVAYLFTNMGYKAEVTNQSRDDGVDVVLKLEKFGLSHKWLVQAKRYSKTVGVKEIREYSSLRYQDDVEGIIVVTTDEFTDDAKTEAKKHNLKLIEGGLLVEMLNYYCPDGQEEPEDIISENSENLSIADDVILKNDESVMANEPAVVKGQKLMVAVTNKNIYLIKKTLGIFSRKTDIYRQINVNNIVGIHTNNREIYLLTGQNGDIEIFNIHPKKPEKLFETFSNLKAEYTKGEYLLKFEIKKEGYLILTSKRLMDLNSDNEVEGEFNLKNIVGTGVTNTGLFKKQKLVVWFSSDKVNKYEIDVDNVQEWQNSINGAVKTV
ncbi:restriction endonuclease [Methanohalobium evestigatum Z-7303]|uniref:Restriction endonuclease n=1 Tax=Methanohalobium evestigatum (strain ATCC BAA-1072 / DSM 3721 / NBRC 107634 / OCM 161 / Z-7303) TaxID=644295 RepID=D7E7H5_METEZ|nr:restriction endonuclease [Methanohalobium evestigatum]ADI73924.1 restriction endonuclease [Methanohalobium evestigatum Z-7303]